MTKEISSALFSLELNSKCEKRYVPIVVGVYRVTTDGNTRKYFKFDTDVSREVVVEDLMKSFERMIWNRLIKGACDE